MKLGFTAPRTPTRRWYYFIPAEGEAQRLVHRIEAGMLDALEGVKTVYSSWQTQASGLTAILGGAKRVAMQYSPNCAVFTLSMVDAGTVELIRGLGVDVVTSANLIQYFEARWTPEKLDSHIAASSLVDNARRAAFARIGDKLRAGERVGEYEIQQFILGEFAKAGLLTDHGPIVGVNENASNPHYEPTAEHHAEIKKGDIVLIDLWAKLDKPGSVYYDVTWTGFAGSQPTSEMENVFAICMGGRDAGINRVKRGVAEGDLQGYMVDDATRGYITERGYGEYFVHRTGHSIGEDVHGSGANMDNLETHDERRVIPWSCFSIEPGIYLPRFGVRSEVNVFVGDREAKVFGEIQERLVAIL